MVKLLDDPPMARASRSVRDEAEHLRREIDLYDARLSRRPWHVVANKIDLPGAAENLAAFRQRYPEREVLAISARSAQGVEELKAALDRWLQRDEPEITDWEAAPVLEGARRRTTDSS